MDNRINALFDLLNEMKESAYEIPASDFASYKERLGRYNGIKESIQVLLNLEQEDE